ncbi:MAG: anti-sigma factor [Verrucomicrobia bacterium]|nr:anti-sigma factor [Verrucomicrobiota bacterium]
MIDERHEELAALYSLDLLEGAERASFESALAQDPVLRDLVRDLRDSSASLAHTAPAATPPAALRARVLATIAAAPAGRPAPAEIIRPPLSLFRTVLPWAVAACFALSAVWVGQLYLAATSEASLLRDSKRVTELSLKSTEQQLEAERILNRRKILDTEKQVADTTVLLTDARTQLAARDGQLATLTQRIDALTGASADLGRQLGEARERVAALTDQLKRDTDLANLKITALASLLKDNPQALAVAVWNPGKQEGTLKFEKLPALAPNEDYQLWVVDPQYKDPVDGGVFTVDPKTGEGRIAFQGKQPIKSVNAFAVTRERKGGVPKAEGPFVLLGK